jgi:membrane protease subunit HflC
MTTLMTPRVYKWALPGLFLAILSLNTIFVVSETEHAIIFQFGEMRHVYSTPGMKAKIPFVQNVRFLEKRLIDYERPAFNITLLDQKRIVVDVYAVYRIADPLKYYKAVRDEVTARSRLDEIIPGTLKAVFGGFSLSQIISEDRRKTLDKLLSQVNKSAHELGIEVLDARIRRSDLPPKNSAAIFERMRAERQRVAREIRAQGEETAREIRATADKEQTIIIAEAEKTSQLTRGQAQAQAITTLASAIEKDPSFYEFYRSLAAYRKALKPDSTTYILSPKSEFFTHFNSFKK